MIKKENPAIRALVNALHKRGDPEFMLYEIGQPMLVTFKNNKKIVGYYSGDNQRVIKMGFINTPRGIVFNMRDYFARSYVKRTRKLVEETPQDGFPGYGCNPANVQDIIRMIIERYSPEESPIVEVSYKGGDMVGFLRGANPDDATLNIAHQQTKGGRYDKWLNPKLVDGRDGYERDHCDIIQPTLDKIISISVLRPEK